MGNYLLSIAIDKYVDKAFSTLNNAVQDAKRFVNILVNHYSFNLIDSLLDERATRKSIIEAINNLNAILGEEDSLIIYFAGHGEMNPKTKKGFWIPHDARNEISDFIPNSSIIDGLSGIDAKHIMLIIDSCFSGTFLTQNRSAIDYHYVKLFQNKSRWAFSSGRHEKVSDGQLGIGSPFSMVLNEFLKQNTHRAFTFLELATAVSKATGNSVKQQPVFAHIEGLGHEDGQFVFNINTPKIDFPVRLSASDLSKIVISFDSAKKIKELGFSQTSIFGYFQEGNSIVVDFCSNKSNFLCSAFTYEEIVEFIPETIDVDENTYIANTYGYEKLGKPKQEDYDLAFVIFRRTEVLDTPYLALCQCRDRMVAFSVDNEGTYNNLICWGINQADSAAQMIIALVADNKIIVR
jgi:hypothetical protein